jgi:hypothetical protein
MSLAAFTWLAACTARAEDKQPAPPAISPAIAARIHWIDFSMVSGRIVASSNLSVPKMLVQSPGRRTNRRESLGIEINGGACSMEYVLASPTESLRIAVTDGNTLAVRRMITADERYELSFEQRPDSPLTLAIERGGQKQQWQAPGLWRLYLTAPEVVREQLIPLLEQLHPSWQLAARAAEIEAALFRTERLHARQPADRQRWAELVRQLASERFADRETAERELRAAGQAVVPYLQNLASEQLDAEQATRIRAIVGSLSVEYEDRVDRVVAWLAGDETVWLTLLDRDDLEQRRFAAKQLSALLGQAIEFDPEATAEVRREQVERLRRRASATNRPLAKRGVFRED